MQPFETWLKADLQAPVTVKRIDGNLFSGDNQGNLVGVTVTDSGEPATLSGEVRGYFIRSDGNTVIMSGTIDGNKVTVVLPSACYTVVGQFSLVIKVGQVAVGACTGYVYQSNTDSTVDPEHVIPDIDQLLTRVEALEGRATTLEGDVSAQNNTINAIEDGLAIIATGNVHPAIANGQFVFVKGHSSLAEGLYRATASIGTNATLSTSNLTADGSGGLNALKGEVDSLNSNLGVSYGGTEVASSCASGEYTEAVTATIPAGVYVVVRGCDFNASSAGVRRVGKTNGAGRTEFVVVNAASSGDTVVQHVEILVAQSQTTIKNIVYQNSGSTINIWPYMVAIRLK